MVPVAAETDRPTSQIMRDEPAGIPSLRILIVDDHHDLADALARLLSLGGHETYTAHDGLAAVEKAASLRPDVILLDIGLPVLNGYEAAQTIRERQSDKRPILVALTGRDQDADRRRSESAGFDAHLVKPIVGDELEELLVRLCEGSAS